VHVLREVIYAWLYHKTALSQGCGKDGGKSQETSARIGGGRAEIRTVDLPEYDLTLVALQLTYSVYYFEICRMFE